MHDYGYRSLADATALLLLVLYVGFVVYLAVSCHFRVRGL